jgi:hypothetical protein
MTLAFLKLEARETWRLALAIAVGSYLFFVVVFAYGLNFRFPAGWIADALDMDAFDSYLLDPIIQTVLGR